MFGENISNLLSSRYVLNLEITLQDFIMNKMQVNFNMFGGSVEEWISQIKWISQSNCTSVITPNQRRSGLRDATKLMKEALNLDSFSR